MALDKRSECLALRKVVHGESSLLKAMQRIAVVLFKTVLDGFADQLDVSGTQGSFLQIRQLRGMPG